MSDQEVKIRVCHFFFPGPWGGAEKVTSLGFRGLKDQIAQTLIIGKELRNTAPFLFYSEILKKNNLTFQPFPCKNRFDMAGLFKLRQYLKKIRPSIIHTHGHKALFYAFIANWNLPSSIVHTHHGDTSHNFKIRFYESLVKVIMKRLACTITVSESMKKDLVENHQFQPSKIKVIENMAHAETIPRTVELPPPPYHLAFIGRLSKEKGLADFLKGLAALDHQNQFITHIIGSGPEEQALKSLAHQLNVNDHLKWHGFLKDPSEILDKSHALIMPSHREGLPMTLLEAMLAGKPVLATQVGAIPRLIDHGSNGLLLSPQDPASWPEILKAFKESYKDLAQGAQAKIILIQKQYGIDQWLKKTQYIYDQVLSDSTN